MKSMILTLALWQRALFLVTLVLVIVPNCHYTEFTVHNTGTITVIVKILVFSSKQWSNIHARQTCVYARTFRVGVLVYRNACADDASARPARRGGSWNQPRVQTETCRTRALQRPFCLVNVELGGKQRSKGVTVLLQLRATRISIGLVYIVVISVYIFAFPFMRRYVIMIHVFVIKQVLIYDFYSPFINLHINHNFLNPMTCIRLLINQLNFYANASVKDSQGLDQTSFFKFIYFFCFALKLEVSTEGAKHIFY